MEYFFILTVKAGNQTASLNGTLTLSRSATRREAFQYACREMARLYGQQFMNGAVLFFSVEPDQVTEPAAA
jgi:hypothetical protein